MRRTEKIVVGRVRGVAHRHGVEDQVEQGDGDEPYSGVERAGIVPLCGSATHRVRLWSCL